MTAIRVPEVDETDQRPYREAIEFLYDRINYERLTGTSSRYPFRLRRMKTLLQRLGLPKYLHQPGAASCVPLVHVAGTKGKGSTASMVAAGLSASGLRTGLYTSPHLHRLEERFRIDGQCCPPAQLVELVDRLRKTVDSSSHQPVGSASFFELTTALALMHFDASQCDAIVLEVGLGGRLDSTNVCSPTVSAITSIGLDHQHVLGDTLEQIAAEKAGIIKPGVPVVSGVDQPHVADVIRKIAVEREAPLFEVGDAFSFESEPDPDWGSQVTHRFGSEQATVRTVPLSLEGSHQADNAAVAMTCLDLLDRRGVSVDWSAVTDRFGTLSCPARVERMVMPADTTVIVDAAHNEDSIEALCRCLRHRFGSRKITVVFGTSRDKSAGPMLAALFDVADHVVLTRYHTNPRHLPTDRMLAATPEGRRSDVTVMEDPISACTLGLDRSMPGGVLVVCGSFFLVAETRDHLARLAIDPD